MSGCNQWALLKVVEMILCISCLCYKWWTDEEASRLFFLLEKSSREWPLQNNVTWNQAGSWFADVVFGGYAIITLGLLVAHIMGELKYTRKTETFLLGFGALLFFGAGCIIITSFDNVPDGLIDNAIILGFLAILTGFLFVIDICCLRSRVRANKATNQEKEFRMRYGGEAADRNHNGLAVSKAVISDKPQDKVITELKSSMKRKNMKQTTGETTPGQKMDNEQKQTRGEIQHGRKRLEHLGFSVGENPKRTNSREGCNNSYDYDAQSIKRYEDKLSVGSTDSNDDSDYGSSMQCNRKSRASQTKRQHSLNEKLVVERRHSKDAETTTDASAHVAKSTFVNVVLQSSKISTTDKSDNSTWKEGYKVLPAASSPYLVSDGRKMQTVLTPSRIENAIHINDGPTTTTPSSPTDPGYVLHTAAKWPNASPLGPSPYQKLKETRTVKSMQTGV